MYMKKNLYIELDIKEKKVYNRKNNKKNKQNTPHKRTNKQSKKKKIHILHVIQRETTTKYILVQREITVAYYYFFFFLQFQVCSIFCNKAITNRTYFRLVGSKASGRICNNRLNEYFPCYGTNGCCSSVGKRHGVLVMTTEIFLCYASVNVMCV